MLHYKKPTFKRSENIQICNSKKYPIGSVVYGKRFGSKSHNIKGTVVECYYTLNDNDYGFFKNQAFRLLCEDGKYRSYQFVKYYKDKETK